MKLGWLKRYLKSDGKWKAYADLVEFEDIFKFGNAFTESVMEISQVPFWADVLKSLKTLWSRNTTEKISNVFLTPIWYNDNLRIPLKHEWLNKGITIIADLLDEKTSNWPPQLGNLKVLSGSLLSVVPLSEAITMSN